MLGGGEAGKEAVLPIHLLKDYIREENLKNNGLLVKAFKEAFTELSLVAENNIYLGDRKLAQILTDMVLKRSQPGNKLRTGERNVKRLCRMLNTMEYLAPVLVSF